MPADDTIYPGVRAALLKDGWVITDDPYRIRYEDVTVYADLAAEKVFAAERGGVWIAVEVKSFLGPSPIHDLEVALGQYQLYRTFMGQVDPGRKLYLAVSESTYLTVFSRRAVQFLVGRQDLALLVVSLTTEEVVTWTEPPNTGNSS